MVQLFKHAIVNFHRVDIKECLASGARLESTHSM